MIYRIKEELKKDLLATAQANGIHCRFFDDDKKCLIKQTDESKEDISAEFAKYIARITRYKVTYINTMGQCQIRFIKNDLIIDSIHYNDNDYFVLESQPVYVKKNR